LFLRIVVRFGYCEGEPIMMFIRGLPLGVMLAVAAGKQTADPVGTCDTTLKERNDIRKAVLATLQTKDYKQQHGDAQLVYPPGDPQSPIQPSRGAEFSINGASPYQMYSERDVMVWIGCTPPKGTWYWGFSNYVTTFDKHNPSDKHKGPQAALGDSLNQLNTHATSDDFWNSTSVIILTADKTAAMDVIGALDQNAPFLSSAVNVMVIPSLITEKLKLGLGDDYSNFVTGCRLAPGYSSDMDESLQDAMKLYLSNNEPLLYLDGRDLKREANLYPTPPLTSRSGGGTAEDSLMSAFDELVYKVKQRAFDMGFVAMDEQSLAPLLVGEPPKFYINGTKCIERVAHGSKANCIQDSQDALYTTLKMDFGKGDAMQVFVGFNHRKSKMATYGYVGVSATTTGFDINDQHVNGHDAERSAVPWAPHLPNADYFIVSTLATRGLCATMPSDIQDFCHDMPVLHTAGEYAERAYLNPVTKTGPSPSEVKPSKVLLFKKMTKETLVSAAAVSAASAGGLQCRWTDCGDSTTHWKLTGCTPDTITTGENSTIKCTGNLDEDVAGADFDLEFKNAVTTFPCKGDASKSKTCSLPLGSGSFSFDGMPFPVKKGSTSIGIGLTLSAQLPGILHEELKATATTSTGDKFFCIDIWCTPAEIANATIVV